MIDNARFELDDGLIRISSEMQVIIRNSFINITNMPNGISAIIETNADCLQDFIPSFIFERNFVYGIQ